MSLLKIPFVLESLMLSARVAKLSDFHAQPNLLSIGRAPLVVPKPGPTPSRDCRPTAPGHGASTVSTRTGVPQRPRSILVGVALSTMVRLALRPGHCQGGDGDLLASPGISSLLDLEE